MSDTLDRTPLQELQVPQGLNLADLAAANLLKQLLHAQNAINVSQAAQNSQSAVAGKLDKQITYKGQLDSGGRALLG